MDSQVKNQSQYTYIFLAQILYLVIYLSACSNESKQKIIEPDKLISKPMFHVENFPRSDEFAEDEKELLDEKIKESSEVVDSAV